ncbi:MAG: serine hydrolase domain-containing protein [Hyphomicrobium sp.]
MLRLAQVLIAALALLTSGAANADWPAQGSRRVEELIQHYLRPSRTRVVPTGLSVSIGVNGDMVFAAGFGTIGADAKATATTVYHIGSLTKQFTAAAMLKRIEDGARAPLSRRPLGLDTQLRDIFDGTEKWAVADQSPVTVHSLLTMTSNLPNFTAEPPGGADPWGAVEAPQLFAALKRQVPRGWPNTFEYSNTGYFLLAQIIEASLQPGAGHPRTLRDYVRDALLRPAGLRQTGFVGDDAMNSVVAQPQFRRRPAFAQPHWLDGCADMASNAVDLFAWNKALIEGRLISPANLKAMFSDAARVDPATYYGMGWYVRHEPDWDSYFHSGSVPGYTSYNAIEKNRADGWISVTLLTNSDGVEGLDELADDIFNIVRDTR